MKNLLTTCLVGLVLGISGGCASKPIAKAPAFQPEAPAVPPAVMPLVEQAQVFRRGTWVVRTMRGAVHFREETGGHPLARVGARLYPGTSVETGYDGVVDLYMVNVGVMRVLPGSKVRLDELALDEGGRAAVLKMTLAKGRMMGNARYLGKGSSYLLKFPGGQSEFGGGDFDIADGLPKPRDTAEARLYFNVKEGGPNSVEVKTGEPIQPGQEYIFAGVHRRRLHHPPTL